MSLEYLLERAREFTWSKFDQNSSNKPFHIFHTCLFLSYAEQLILVYESELNADVVRLASLMHDIARPPEDLGITKKVGRLKPHHVDGANLAKTFLQENGYPYAEQVAEAILSHGGKIERKSPESKAVYDCQRLSDSSPALYTWFIHHSYPANKIKTFFEEEFLAGRSVPPHFDYSQNLFREHEKVIRVLLKYSPAHQ